MIFANEIEQAEAFVTSINLGIEPADATRLVYGREPLPLPPSAAREFYATPEEPMFFIDGVLYL